MQLNSNPVWKGAHVSTPVAMRARTPEQQQAHAELLMTGPLHDAALTAHNHFVHAATVRTATGTVTCWELERARLITGHQDWNVDVTKLASQQEQARHATDARWRNAADTLRAVTDNGKADRVDMKTLLQKTWDAADVLMTALENSCQKAERDVTQKNDGKHQQRLQTARTVDVHQVTT